MTAAALRAAGLDVLEAPARYVSSEESALISLAQGGLARPMTKRAPFVTGGRDASGRAIRPTLVLNAETTWRVAQIVTHGPEWFRSVGTAAEPGPRLLSVGGAVRSPTLVDTAAGVSFPDLFAAAGGPSRGSAPSSSAGSVAPSCTQVRPRRDAGAPLTSTRSAYPWGPVSSQPSIPQSPWWSMSNAN